MLSQGIHSLNYDPLLLPESSLCLTSIAQGFSTWVFFMGIKSSVPCPNPQSARSLYHIFLSGHSLKICVMWMDLVVAKLMLVKLSCSLIHTSPSPNKKCTKQGVSNNRGEERYDYKV